MSLFCQKTEAVSEYDIIKQAHSYLNTSKDSLAYHILKKLVNTSTTYTTQVRANSLLAQYFLNKPFKDSVAFYTDLTESLLIENTEDTLRFARLGRLFNVRALYYKKQGLHTEASLHHLKGIEMSKKANDAYGLFINKHGLANSYAYQNRYDEALTLLKTYLEKTSDPLFIYSSHINIGDILLDLEEYQEALSHFEIALPMCEAVGDLECLTSVYINLGRISLFKNQFEKAITYFDQAHQLSENQNSTQKSIIASIMKAKALIELKSLDTAESILLETLSKANSYGFFFESITAYTPLIQIYQLRNHHQKAFDVLLQQTKIKDSVESIQQQKKLHELEVQFKTLQKEKAIMGLERQQELQFVELTTQKGIRNILGVASFVIVIPILILLILYKQKLKTKRLLHEKQREINEQQIASLLNEQELQLIKASIKGQYHERKRIAQDLHDVIGGNLAAIKLQFSNYTLKGTNHSTIYEQLDETYDLVRNLSHHLLPSSTSKVSFTAILNALVNRKCTENAIINSLEIYPEESINNLANDIQKEIFYVIDTLLNYAATKAAVSKIEIQLQQLQESIHLLFEDNGKGFNFETTQTKKLIELKNNYDAFHIDVHPKRGTIVNIELPLKPNT